MDVRKNNCKDKRNLSLNGRKRILKNSIEQNLPKTKDANVIRSKYSLSQSPLKQCVIPQFFMSPKKNEDNKIKYSNIAIENRRSTNKNAKQKLSFDQKTNDDVFVKNVSSHTTSFGGTSSNDYNQIRFEVKVFNNLKDKPPLISAKTSNDCDDPPCNSNSSKKKQIHTNPNEITNASLMNQQKQISPKKAVSKQISPKKAVSKQISPKESVSRKISPNKSVSKKITPKKSLSKKKKSFSLNRAQLLILKRSYERVLSPSKVDPVKSENVKITSLLKENGTSLISSSVMCDIDLTACDDISEMPHSPHSIDLMMSPRKNNVLDNKTHENSDFSSMSPKKKVIGTPTKNVIMTPLKNPSSIIENYKNGAVTITPKKITSEIYKNGEVTITPVKVKSLSGDSKNTFGTESPRNSSNIVTENPITREIKTNKNYEMSIIPKELNIKNPAGSSMLDINVSALKEIKVEKPLNKSPTKRVNSTQKSSSAGSVKKDSILTTPTKPLFNGSPVKLSPKIRRRPRKFFNDDSLREISEVLPKSPSKSPTKSKSPQKRNLSKDFNQAATNNKKTLDLFLKRSNLNTTSFDQSQLANLLTEDVDILMNGFESLINDKDTMEKMRLECLNKPMMAKQIDLTQQSNGTLDLHSKQSPTKISLNKIVKMKSDDGNRKFVVYLFDNPVIKYAEKKGLLDHDEFKGMMHKFTSMPLEARLLFGKMFERTPIWYRVDDDLVKKYCDSFGDVKGLVAMMKENGFVINDLSSVDLLHLVNLLNVKEMKNVCKYFKIKVNNGSKDIMIKELLNHATQACLFGNLANKIKSNVVKELGQCVRLSNEFKEMFNLLVVLATYPYYRDEEKKRLSDLILRLNQLNSKIKTLPPYICKPDVAFRNIQHLTDYVQAVNFVAHYSNLVENKDWEDASNIVIDAKSRFSDFISNLDNSKLLEDIGGHLVRFTAGYQYAYCLSSGITILKKDSKYANDCIEILKILLSQNYYLVRKRGIWYEEMALIHQKNKDLLAAYQCVVGGLQDDSVDLIRRRMLSQRASTLIKRKTTAISDGMRCQLHSLMVPDFQPETHTITAKYHEGIAGRKQIFYRECLDGETEFCSVEEIVIDYYKNKANPNYKNGLHDEGRTIMTLVVACFFDIIYCETDGDSMFHSDLQTHPLDWGGRHFFHRRKSLIENHLEELRMGGLSAIMILLQNICENFEKTDSAINWNYLTSEKLSNIKELLECLGANVFLKIAGHVISDYKLYHSGFPDLILWDPPTKRCLLVEVKGPNDKLSASQIVWIENLRKFGVDALVCHVESTGSRKRKAT